MIKKFAVLLLAVLLCTGCQSETDGAPAAQSPGGDDGMSQSEQTATPDTSEGEDMTEVEDMTPAMIVSLMIGDERYNIETAGNPTAADFYKRVSSEPLSLKMEDYGGFEKNAELPWELSSDEDEQVTVQPGEIVLYQGKTLALLYEENTAAYTRLGIISETEDVKEELFKKLKKGKTVDMELMAEFTE